MRNRATNNSPRAKKEARGKSARRARTDDKIGEAEESFKFMVDLRDDVTAPHALRKGAAEWIWENVMGKPLQRASSEMPPETRAMLEKYYALIGIANPATPSGIPPPIPGPPLTKGKEGVG